MSRRVEEAIRRLAIALAIAAIASGCAQRRSYLNPQPDGSASLAARALTPGAQVALDLKDGSRLEGEVLSVAADSLILSVERAPKANIDRSRRLAVPRERRAVALGDIRSGRALRPTRVFDAPMLVTVGLIAVVVAIQSGRSH